MKRLSLLFAFGAGIFMTLLLSMTVGEARKDTYSSQRQVVYLVPLKPKSTLLVRNCRNVSKYTKKGYQVQQIDSYGDYVLFVKY